MFSCDPGKGEKHFEAQTIQVYIFFFPLREPQQELMVGMRWLNKKEDAGDLTYLLEWVMGWQGVSRSSEQARIKGRKCC